MTTSLAQAGGTLPKRSEKCKRDTHGPSRFKKLYISEAI